MDGLLTDLEVIRKDFPILERPLEGGHPLVYLDSANTAQKPQVVIDAMVDHLERHNANVARAMHQLGAESTEGFEGGRDKVAAFLNAPSRDEVIFTKNASEALNLVANTLAWATGPLAIGEGDEVLITEMEHHSNIVPWQLLTERKGATLRWFGITDDGQPGALVGGGGLFAQLVAGPVDVRVVPLVELRHRVDHLAGLLRGVRAVQVGQRLPAADLALQDREVLPDPGPIEGHEAAPALTNSS